MAVGIDQKKIDTFTSVTGLSPDVAIQKLKERHGNLVDALDAVYDEADKSIAQDTISSTLQTDVVRVDDPQSSNSVATDDIEDELTLAAIFEASKEDMNEDLDLALAISSSYLTILQEQRMMGRAEI